MLDRGNLLAGFSALGIVFYVFTVLSKRWRLFGILMLAVAINFRPNDVVFVLLELTGRQSLLKAASAIVSVGLAAIAIGLGALLWEHALDHRDSLSRFLHDLAVYQQGWVVGDYGIPWNESLLGALKSARALLGIRPHYQSLFAQLIAGLGLATTLAFIALIFVRLPTRAEAIFLLAAIGVIFTPVLSTYHLAMMLAPLLVVLNDENRVEAFDYISLFVLSYLPIMFAASLFDAIPNWIMLTALIATALVVVGMLYRTLAAGAQSGESDALVVLLSTLGLAPMGGALSQAICVSLILLPGVFLVMISIWRRGVRRNNASGQGPPEGSVYGHPELAGPVSGRGFLSCAFAPISLR
jgi:hypothetical protein